MIIKKPEFIILGVRSTDFINTQTIKFQTKLFYLYGNKTDIILED